MSLSELRWEELTKPGLMCLRRSHVATVREAVEDAAKFAGRDRPGGGRCRTTCECCYATPRGLKTFTVTSRNLGIPCRKPGSQLPSSVNRPDWFGLLFHVPSPHSSTDASSPAIAILSVPAILHRLAVTTATTTPLLVGPTNDHKTA